MNVFGETDTPVLRMIQRAAKVYKHIYGEYPESVGLDIFSRFREWQDTPFCEWYYWRDMKLIPGSDPLMLAWTNESVKVEPATFSPIKYNALKLDPRPTDPTQGQNGAWCKRGEHEVAIDLCFTKSGYHAVIGERSDFEAWQTFKALTLRDE